MRIEQFCESLQRIKIAVSLGGLGSLIIPKCAGIASADFEKNNRDNRMMLLYVGLEDADYLIKDLEQALGKMEV